MIGGFLGPLAAEIFLLVAICVILIQDAFSYDQEREWTYRLSQLALLISGILVATGMPANDQVLYGGHYRVDTLALLLKLGIIVVSMLALTFARPYILTRRILRGEYFLLVLFAVLGAMVMVAGNSLLTLYLGLELMSLSLYALVAMQRGNRQSAEAAVKYFVMGALASGFLLYGMSILYGVTGSLIIQQVAQIGLASEQQLLFQLGLVFLVSGLAFKVGAVPFQMWLPDVYQGAPSGVTAFISSAPKIAAYGLIIRLLSDALQPFAADWQQLLSLLAVLSIAVGNVVAIAQTSLKRMLAYSAIAHVGYFLLGIIAGDSQGFAASMFYILVYAFMSVGAFGAVIYLSFEGEEREQIEDFRGLASRNLWQATLIAFLMLSLAGLPPFAGFWAKFEVIRAVALADQIWLAIVAVIFSIVGLFYYLRLIKVMFFDEPEQAATVKAPRGLRFALGACGLGVFFLGIFPGMLLEYCLQAFNG